MQRYRSGMALFECLLPDVTAQRLIILLNSVPFSGKLSVYYFDECMQII
jgi:hypothetical protein